MCDSLVLAEHSAQLRVAVATQNLVERRLVCAPTRLARPVQCLTHTHSHTRHSNLIERGLTVWYGMVYVDLYSAIITQELETRCAGRESGL